MKKTIKNKKTIYILVAIILIGLVYVAVAWFQGWYPFKRLAPTPDVGVTYVNMDKTDTEKNEINNLNDNPENKTTNIQTDKPVKPEVSADGKKAANVVITNAGVYDGNVEVRGYVSNVNETGGVCKYVFIKRSQHIEKTVNTLPNADSTVCVAVKVPAVELGDSVEGWKVSLVYESATSEGTSPTRSIDI